VLCLGAKAHHVFDAGPVGRVDPGNFTPSLSVG
jgi:hypothetical protein